MKILHNHIFGPNVFFPTKKTKINVSYFDNEFF
jgi:hypothetical protein